MDPEQARLPLFPKEHGASFMALHALLLGIVAGFAAGGRDVAGLLLALAFGVLTLPLTAAVSVMSRAAVAARAKRRAAELLMAMAVASTLALLHGPGRQLLVLGSTGVVLSGVYAIGRQMKGPRSVPAQLAAIACISLLAPLAWLLVAGSTPRWPLSAPAAFLAFGGTLPYVRERVRRRRFAELTLRERLAGGLPALSWQAATLAVAVGAAAADAVGWLAAVAFAPGAVKTFLALLRPERRPPIRSIGVVETVISTVFAVVVGIGLGLIPFQPGPIR